MKGKDRIDWDCDDSDFIPTYLLLVLSFLFTSINKQNNNVWALSLSGSLKPCSANNAM